jgi:hypothetical protein
MMNWKGFGRIRSWPNFRHYPGICLEELRKPTKNLSQNSWCPGRNLNPKHEARVLTTRQQSSVRAGAQTENNIKIYPEIGTSFID